MSIKITSLGTRLIEKSGTANDRLGQIGNFQHVFLATIEGDQPRVRPVTLINFEGKFWVTTETRSEKVKQIMKNPKVELSFIFKKENKNCCLRITGVAKIIGNRKVKAKLARHCDFFSRHWKSVDDPNYTLLQIIPSEITYVTPEETKHIRL